MPVVAIRADASRPMGTGHLKRCLALAQALRDCGARVVFVTRAMDDVTPVLMRGCAFEIFWLGQSANCALRDAQDTADVLRALSPVWVLVDHYGLDGGWHEAVRSQLGSRIAVIDDLADRVLAPDLLIEPNDVEAAQTYTGRLMRPCKLLAGPHFAPLAPSYAASPRYHFNQKVRSIGIFMGGTDPKGASLDALRACRARVGFAGPIEIVCSPLAPGYAVLAAACERWPATRLIDGLPDLAGFFARHDLQIGAGGGATWERCCIGAPTLACLVAPNQLATLPRLESAGALVWAREEPDLETSLARHVAALIADPTQRRELGQAAMALVDGKGARRVAATMACAWGAALEVRPVHGGDEALLFDWANDAVVRANAFNPEPITLQQHARWFRARLADTQGCRIFILQAVNGIEAGQVRFDRRDDCWEIGYSMDCAFRQLGLGGQLLRAAVAALASEMGTVQVMGRVKPDNVASARIFSALGFQRDKVQDERGPHWLFSLTIEAP